MGRHNENGTKLAAVRAVPVLLLGACASAVSLPQEPLAAAEVPAGRAARPEFVDVTRGTGISFVERCGSLEKDWILEVNGSGVALFDCDNDGDLDIYFVNSSLLNLKPSDPRPRNELYRNDGGWRFTDVTDLSGTGDEGWGSGAAVADFDNDGFLDLYVTNWGPNVVYRNRGDGTFQRMERTGAEDPRWTISACVADFNRDGLVDIFAANYVEFEFDPSKKRGVPECYYKGVPIFCGPGGLKPSPDSLFINEGNFRFRDASVEWGVRETEPGFGMGSLVVDLQRDGFPDVLVANDTNKNFCFVNQGGKRFVEAGLFLGLAYNDYGVAQASMGLASGDARGLGKDDIFVTNYEDDTCTLHLAEEGGIYSDGTFPAGLGAPTYRYMSWGTFFFDADGDGDLDLFIANGHLAPQMMGVRASLGYRQASQLYLNDGSAHFELCRECLPASAASGSGEAGSRHSSRGAACGDLDGDGDPDIVVNNIDEAPTVLENRSAARWVAVHLRGTRSNRAAVGTRVIISAGGRRQERTIQSGMSYASQCELAARFGLGGAERVDSLRVEWPSGLVEEFAPPKPGETILATEGTGAPARDRTSTPPIRAGR